MECAPTLETARLRLLSPQSQDWAESAAMWGDPAVTRFIGGRPLSPEECWSRLLRYVGHWASLGFGYWIIRDKADGRFVGEAGFADYRRDLSPSLHGIPEIGWALSPSVQGRGYALEAVRAIQSWGDAMFQDRTVCIIDPDNLRSIRLAETCGYRAVATLNYKGAPTILFERFGPKAGDPTV